jgi:hypothetical protein
LIHFWFEKFPYEARLWSWTGFAFW